MNELVNEVGFIDDVPVVEELKDGTKVGRFSLCVYNKKDTNCFTKIPFSVFGDKCTLVQKTLLKGTFVECKGNIINLNGTRLIGRFKAPLIEIHLESFEVIDSPEISGMGVKEFVKLYSNEGISASEKRKGKEKS